jgi:hypothetical protein
MNDHNAKDIVDGFAVFTTLGTMMEFLPAIASLFTIIWLGIRIYESDTVQAIFNRKAKSSQDAIDE